nr:B3 domain-containing transcription factor VRN1 [Ipomoea batatas]GME11042.1 B3 domain-containing transcription factor VRN1 [Ipomoea batatas]
MRTLPCASSPCFSQIITRSVSDQSQLRIPDGFVERYGHYLSGEVKLTVHTGDEWCVRLKKVGKTVLFTDGWRKFMEYYSIGIGYFLLFIYTKSACFDVHLFNKTATEIWDLPSTNANAERSTHISQDLQFTKEKCVGISDCGGIDDGNRSVKQLDDLTCHQVQENLADLSGLGSGCKRQRAATGWVNVQSSYRTRGKGKMFGEEGGISDAENVPDDGYSNEPLFAKSLLGSESRHNNDSAGLIVENANNQQISGKKGTLVSDDGKSDIADRLSPIFPNCKTDGEGSNIKQEKKRRSVSSKSSSKHIMQRQATAQEKERASRDAKMFAPNNPYFTVSLKEYNVSGSIVLHIPREFTKEYLPIIPKNVEVQDSEGNSWNIKCINKPCFLSKGWAAFVREKNLAAGDACGFELIKYLQDDNLVFKVHIFRAVLDNANEISLVEV